MRSLAYIALLATVPSIEADNISPQSMPYGVTGIEEGEILTARTGTSRKMPVAFEIPRDAASVVPIPSHGGGWIRVKYEGKFGYVPRHNLAIGQAGGLQFPGLFSCEGADGAWSIFANPGFIFIDAPDEGGRLIVPVHARPTSADAMQVDTVDPIRKVKAVLSMRKATSEAFTLKVTFDGVKVAGRPELNGECHGIGKEQLTEEP
jgi:hypothetical protein